mgnify:CR=1 FL=1
MDVVRHEAPSQQAITLSIEMQKCLLHERGNGGGPEPALSQSRIEFAIKKMNGFALHSQCFDDLARQAIGKPEGDELNRLRRIEMRQIAS